MATQTEVTIELVTGAGLEGLAEALASGVRLSTEGARVLVAGQGQASGALARAASTPEIDAVVLIAPETLGTVPDNVPGDLFCLFGSRDPQRSARMTALREALPGIMIALVQGAGADPLRERPEIVARAVADFARRRQACVVSERDARIESAPLLQEGQA